MLLVIGPRIHGAEVACPFDDLALSCMNGERVSTHEHGNPYPRRTIG